jgi:hypothetical protein
MRRRDFLLAAPGLALTAMQRKPYTLEPYPAGMALRAGDGRTPLVYLTTRPEGSNLRANSACCFHPVTTPSGERVTDLAPGDHVHHRGVFLAWHSMTFQRKADFSRMGPTAPRYGLDMRRADFWGWGEFAPTADRVIENRTVRLDESTDRSATLGIENSWNVGKQSLLRERTAAAWSERGDANVLDLTYTLTPEWTLILNQTAFGGFCARLRNDGDSWYESPGGRVTLPDAHYSAPELNWPAADWYAYAITLRNGRTVGCAVVDHPANPKSTWHNPRYVWMINPCIVADGPVNVAAGQPLVLRYRLVLFDGQPPAALVKSLSAEWRRA